MFFIYNVHIYLSSGSTVAFSTYVMKKTFAGFHWQELRQHSMFEVQTESGHFIS